MPLPPPPIPPLSNIPGTVDPNIDQLVAEHLRALNSRATASDRFDPNVVVACDAQDLQRVAAELARRRAESLKLYEPLPEQLRFHQSTARIRLLRGSNRAGKTLSAAVELARAVTGQDPHGKYPKADGRAFIVGKDQKHIGQVLWPKLSRARAFKVIRDEVTGMWRAFRPWSTKDQAREHEAKPAPPLIPNRFIKEIAWENKKENVPSMVLLTTGWELTFYTSLGKPPQGSDIDLFWFDEEIVDPQWFPEMSARILDRVGRGMWSATPQAGTDQLYELHEQAEREHDQNIQPRTVEEFVALLDDNPHMTEQAKKDFVATLSEDERRVRVGGDFAVSSYKVYPEFSMHVHGVKHQPIPQHWTRYAAIDPGHHICAVLFAAVPPPDEGDHVYLIGELYLRNCDAAMFGREMKNKTQGQDWQAFVIDAHMGIHTEMGIGKTVAQQYREALEANGVRSRITGSGFVFGSDNVLAGINAVHSLMQIRDCGTPKLRVLEQACPNLEWEIKRYHKKRDAKGAVSDMPNQKKNNHLMDALRYMAMLNPKYVTPAEKTRKLTGAIAALRAKQQRQREAAGGSHVRLG